MQTSYALNQSVGFPGQLYDIGPHDVWSAAAQAPIPFGVGVSLSANSKTCKLPSGSGDVINGIAGFDNTQLASYEAALQANGGYNAKETVNVIMKGRVWVKVETAVAVNDPVFARFTANGGNTQLGAFGNTADGAKATQIPNAKFITPALAGGLAVAYLW